MEDKIRIVAERFKNLLSQGLKAHEIMVFGSRARGDASDASDLDIFIVVDYLDHSVEKFISDCAWTAGFENDIVIVPVAISRDALTKTPLKASVFIRNVYSEGVAV